MEMKIAFLEFLAPLAGAAISTVGNLFGAKENRDQQAAFNAAQIDQAEKNREMQLKFAQEGIRWKAEDARQAGISPLYAMGANTVSYSPVSLGGGADTSLGSAIASSGQDISRAMNATATAAGRADAFTKAVQEKSLTKLDLENQLLASRISQMKASANPPMPSLDPFKVPEADKPEERPQLGMFGRKWETSPGSSNAEEAEKRYGDLAQEVWGMFNLGQDAWRHVTSLPKSSIPKKEHWGSVADSLSKWYRNKKWFY